MLTTVLLGLAILIVVLLIAAATRPDTFEISRSIRIAAPVERILPLIDDPRAMNRWNPFVKADPNIVLDYSGPARGVGAASTFSGTNKVGAGRVTLTEQTATQVIMRLQMDRPMTCDNRIAFTLAPEDGGTRVTWAMSGPQPFIGKLMCLVISSDRMVGGSFEAGLAELKALAEQRGISEVKPLTEA